MEKWNSLNKLTNNEQIKDNIISEILKKQNIPCVDDAGFAENFKDHFKYIRQKLCDKISQKQNENYLEVIEKLYYNITLM